jgi:integrative and conjugative element protein (TIGR02256 family)
VIVYPIGTSGETVEVSDRVLGHLRRHRQMRLWQCEAGGLLFARIDGQRIRIERATGPRRTDSRTPFSYHADRKAEQREIDAMFNNGLHYVGDWHTHPEQVPSPSGRDLKTFASRVLMSTHQFNGILFGIVGRAEPPVGLLLLLHDGREWHELKPLADRAILDKATAVDPLHLKETGGIQA